MMSFLGSLRAHGADFSQVEKIGRSKGLTTEIVTALYQDRSGLVWIGSRDGLRVYDGNSFRLFDHDHSNADSISDNGIRTIYEDDRSRLWIGTNTGGLELLDRSTGKFTHFRHSSADVHSLSNDSVYAIVQEHDGSLWIGTQNGLNHFDPAKGSFDRYLAEPGGSTALSNDYVAALYLDRQDKLWIATVGGGLCSRDPKTGLFSTYRHDKKSANTINSDFVFGITEDVNNHLWIGTAEGLAEFDASKNAWRQFGLGERKTQKHAEVTSLFWGAGTTLWVGALNGLYNIETSTGNVSKQEWSAPVRGVSRDLEVTALLTDNSGGLWVGTWGSGLLRDKPRVGGFGEMSLDQGLSNANVASVLADRFGSLWVGTDGGGLNRRDPRAAAFRHYAVHHFGQTVFSIYQDDDMAMWFGTHEFLGRISPGSKLTTWRHDPADAGSLSQGYVTAILRDSHGQLWAGTGGGGLNLLKKDGKSFEHFQHRADDAATLSDDYVTVLFESSNGTLWVGTRSGGLNECVPQVFRCQRYLPGSESSIGHHYVTSIFEDSTHQLWIGTAGGGLNLLRALDSGAERQFTKYTTREGLPDNNIMSIAEDAGNLWLGTRHGLVHFRLPDHQISVYSTDDGLPADEFNNSAVTQDQTNLYFGTTAGVLTIARRARVPLPLPSPTVLMGIKSLNDTSVSDLPVAVNPAIEVPYGTVLAAEAAVLDFSDPSTHRYQYQLEGLAPQWIDLGSRRSMTFTDLSPGDYRLNVRGRNSHGIWSSAQPLELHIIPPFWMRNSFRALVALLGIAILFAFHRRRTAVLVKRNQQLVEIQTERERALDEARTSGQALQVAYERLQALTRRMEAVAEEERRRIAHELHDEMGQMLTAAKINLQLLPSQTMQESHLNRISDTVGLVDTMISRVRALSLDLRPPLLYELGLMPALRAYVEGQARRSGLKISMKMPDDQLGLAGEVEIAVFRVVQEAVTNVIRHANATRIDVLLTLQDGSLRLEVCDDGSGFDVAEVDSRAAIGDAHHGLAGIRERAQLLGGEAVVAATADGVTITIDIPVPIEAEAACR